MSGEEAKATAFWEGLARLKADWKMEKADLCTFMSGSVAAAISGDEARATAFWESLATLKAEWKMEKADLCTFMSGGVAAAISGEEAKAAAFWDALARLKKDWKMEKADLCTFMSNSVAAAISGEEAKAAAFWDGLRLLQMYLTPSELAAFMSNSIASRLKNGQGAYFAAVVKRLGPKKSKMALTGQPVKHLLGVLPEFVEYMATIVDDEALWSTIDTRRKRELLAAELEAGRG
jgi:hypothetical protein